MFSPFKTAAAEMPIVKPLLTPDILSRADQQVAALQAWQAEAEANRLTYTVAEPFRGKTIYQARLKTNETVIALTFDDGPWPNTTTQILDILQYYHIKATFFWVGQALQHRPDDALRVINDGHAIGNHTWHHWYKPMSPVQAANELDNTANLILEATGARTFLFRPPGGVLNNGLADYALSQNQTVVMWSVTSADTDPAATVQQLVSNVVSRVTPGAIVLMHDGGGDRSTTVEALPQIIETLQQQNYRFVTVPQLLTMQAEGY